MTLILHHLGQSRSERLIWLLEELNAAYELKRYARDPQSRLAPAELAKLHPLGKAPLIEYDGRVMAESGAIALYLLEAFDPDHHLHPAPGAPERAAFLEWMHAAEGAVFLPFLMNTYLTATGLEDSLLAGYMAAEREKALSHIEAHLSAHDWFAGDHFTAADIMMGFQLEAAEARGALKDDSPVHAWLECIRARDAHKRMRAITVDD
jgi:glutathione S-transferase